MTPLPPLPASAIDTLLARGNVARVSCATLFSFAAVVPLSR
jgi:hypothetical protein